MKHFMFNAFPLLLRFLNNFITTKPPSAKGRNQDLERELGKRLPAPCYPIHGKGTGSKNENQKHQIQTDQGEGFKANDLDANDWMKQCLPVERFLPVFYWP